MKKKRIGALLSGGLILLYYSILLFFIIYLQITDQDKLPFPFFVFIICLFFVPIFGVGTALYYRLLEIKNGEEEESKKY